MSRVLARAAAIAATLVVATSAVAVAQTPPAETGSPTVAAVRLNADGTVSIKAEGVALQALLVSLQPACAMDPRLDPKAAARAVSVEADGLTPAGAVREVLKASGLDFAMNTGCGTPAQPMRIVARDAGGGPLVWIPAVPPDPDDPRVKAVVDPPLPAGPPPEPERKDEDPARPMAGGLVVGRPAERELAPGEVTGAMLVDLLAPQPRSTDAVIELPFTDENGRPYLEVRPPESRIATLPFPDANGNLIQVTIPDGPVPQVDFPVVNAGAPVKVKPVPAGPKNPNDARRPGGGDKR